MRSPSPLSRSNALSGFVEFYVVRIRRNCPGFFSEFYLYVAFVTLAAVLDFLST
jgi:hypothetical protein